MSHKAFVVLLFSMMLVYGCSNNPINNYSIKVDHFDLQTQNNIRGLSVVDLNIAWASGTGGIFVVTNDGGKSWKTDSIADAGMLDFRSVHAFDEQNAILVSAGTPARIYKTMDGGKSWNISFSSDDPAIFFDAISFWNANEGLVMGDPVEGKLYLLKTNDGGVTWNRISPAAIPPSMVSEGGFAASGTCLTVDGSENAWIGVGGDSARVYRSSDQGLSWEVHQTPILCGSQMKGIYSLAFKNGNNGIALGGEWNVKKPPKSRAFTTNGGISWELGQGVDSYCSGGCFVKNDIFLACGQSGIDISTDGGRNWKNISDLHLYGIKFDKTGTVGYGTGPGGQIVKLLLAEEK